MTKRIRIYNPFAESQNTRQVRTHVLAFIRHAMKPARHSREPDTYEPLRALLNQALKFAGLAVSQAGELQHVDAVQTLPEAICRARELRADFKGATSIQTFLGSAKPNY